MLGVSYLLRPERRGQAGVPRRCSSCAPTTSSIRCSTRRRWSTLLQRRGQGRGDRDRARIESAAQARDEELAARLQREARAARRARLRRSRRTSGTPASSTSSPSAPASSRTASGARGGCSSACEAALAAISRSALYRRPSTAHAIRPRDAAAPRRVDHSQEDTSRTLLALQLVSGGALLRGGDLGRRRRRPHYQREVVLDDARAAAAPPPAQTAQVGSRRRSALGRLSVSARTIQCRPSRISSRARDRRSTTSTRRSRRSGAARRTTSRSPDPLLADSHAHIHFDGRDFNVDHRSTHGDLYVNGKQAQEAPAGARGRDPDRHHRARVLALRRAGHRRARRRKTHRGAQLLREAVRVLASKLMASYELPTLLDALMDVVIAGHQRRQGLPDPDRVERAARQGRAQPAAREPSPTPSASSPTRSSPRSSRRGKPLIVSDALHDEEFKNAHDRDEPQADRR